MVFSLELNIMILAFLVLASGFFSAAETAIFSIGKIRVKKLLGEQRRNADVLAELKKNPHDLLTTILVGNNLANISAASFATAIALQAFPDEFGIAFAAGATTIAILIFGEITPKSIALKHNESVALFSAPIIKFFGIIFLPLSLVLGKITGVFSRLIGGKDISNVLTEDEVMTFVSLGAEEGAIRKEEKEMIRRIFKLNDIVVEDVMTPRAEVVAIASGTKVSTALKKTMQLHSRIPIFKDDLDEIVGIFYLRDLLGGKNYSKTNLVVDKIMRTPMFVYGNKRIDKLLREFQKKKTHMAVVVDEYGSTIGLITIEDILEEIVGEIIDETDIEYVIKKVKENEFLAEGQVSLERLNKALGTTFSSDVFDTAAGFVIGAMDKVPKEKDEVLIAGIRFSVEKMNGPRIELLRIFK
ncbi:MAG TPA: hemolysin family protein [archaeon]|nr:hemolysin family protein [archaeon]